MKTGILIEEMAAEVVRQSKAKEDYIVDTRRLEMGTSGAGVILRMLNDDRSDAVEPMDIRSIAHSHIRENLKIPATYYDRMLTDNPDLLAHNVNSWFQREPEERMVRTLDGYVRALCSKRYHLIENIEILQAVLPIIREMPDARFESCQLTESHMYIKVVNPRLEQEVRKGDVVQAGVVISNSEVKRGAVCVYPLVLRLVCMNGMVANDAGIRKNHVGRANTADENYLLYSDKTLAADDHAFLLKVQDTVRAAVDEAKFSQVIDLMRGAAETKMTTNEIPAVVKLASKEYKLTDSEGAGILNQLIEDHDYTLYGLSNAVTRFSQDVDSYDRATELEGIGYKMLTMDRQDWTRLNSGALQLAA